jgi:hypothetical protein
MTLKAAVFTTALVVLCVWRVSAAENQNQDDQRTQEQPGRKDGDSSFSPEIVTDRPDITESGIVVPKGSLQAENGLTLTSDHGQRTLDLSETLLRLGVGSRTELRLMIPNYSYGVGGRNPAFGFGDVAVGVKKQLGPLLNGFDLSVIAALSLPTGADRISSHSVDPFLKLPWSRDLKGRWSVGGMFSMFWNTDEGRRNFTWEPTFYVERQITSPLDLFIEYAGDYPQRGGARQVMHIGGAYKVTPKQQVDLHFGAGLSPGAPKRFFAVGYSFRFDHFCGRCLLH